MISVRKNKGQMVQSPGGITVKTQLYSEYHQAVSGLGCGVKLREALGREVSNED